MSTTPSTPAPATINYSGNNTIVLPQADAENRFALRMNDWKRLQRHVEACKKDMKPTLSGWYFLMFGVAGSDVLSLIPLTVATGLPPWVLPTYYCVGIGAAVVGVALMCVSRWMNKERTERLEELRIDMTEIEAGFGQTH